MINPAVRRRIKKFVLWMEVLFILVLGAGVGVVLGAFYQMNKLLPPDAALDAYRAPVGTKIFSSDRILLAKLAVENREPVKLDDIPKDMQNAIVAIEDSRFYSHSGLDFRGLARAVWSNVSGKDITGQGASTITQQLARNMFLSKKKRISRKIKEALLALQIERNWTKRQILEAYLNQVYFGSGAYGVKSASQIYYGKDVRKLSLEEAALLAGLPQRPSEVNPFTNFEEDGNYKRTKSRRNDVLNRMQELGFITRDQCVRAKAKPVKVVKKRPPALGYFHAKHFVQYVVDQLQQRYGQDVIEKAGLEVVTTLNWKVQQAAEDTMVAGIGHYRGWGRVSEGALVCIDPNTGYIRAMVGSVNYPWEKHQFNCATQAKRQPGSSFKAFVYATALEHGRSPYSSVNATASIRMPDGKWYTPHNHGHAGGYMSYVSAFAGSVNGAAVNVAVESGLRNVVSTAQRLGISGKLLAYPSLALGTCEVTPLEMASAYGAFAANGKRALPMAILQVRSQDGEVLEDVQPTIVDTGLKESTIEGMDVLTRAVVTSGTGRAAGIVPDAHGKTGTTEENTDAWFVGYTKGGLVAAVWAGNRDNRPMAASLYGGTICAPIWARFMELALAVNPGKKKPKPPAPATATPHARDRRHEHAPPPTGPLSPDEADRNRIRVNICADSGLLANPGCPSTRMEEYLLGEQPMTHCTLHPAEKGKGANGEKTKQPQAGSSGSNAPAGTSPAPSNTGDLPPPTGQ